MNWIKRIKSGLIMLGSSAVAAIIVLLPSAEFANLMVWLKGVVLSWGLPGVVYAFLAALISQMWMAWLNKRKTARMGFASMAAANSEGVDLY